MRSFYFTCTNLFLLLTKANSGALDWNHTKAHNLFYLIQNYFDKAFFISHSPVMLIRKWRIKNNALLRSIFDSHDNRQAKATVHFLKCRNIQLSFISPFLIWLDDLTIFLCSIFHFFSTLLRRSKWQGSTKW